LRPEVETTGGRLRGAEVRGIQIFRAVPFARPPRGVLRFLPPEPPEPWTGLRDSTKPGAAAPQARLPMFRPATLAARRTSEDCLTLNVWTPGLDAARRPVLVWIHGGGFLIGAGGTPLYDGRSLAGRGDVVVVTVNYRLGALGFADLAAVFGGDFKGTSNRGLRDMIASLEWVRANIERFGGDPGNVTLFGQSAGGMSVASLMAAPKARGLFHRAIAQSGAASHCLDRDEAAEVASVFVQELGGPPADPQAFARLPVGRILDAQHRTLGRLADQRRIIVWGPTVDDDLIPDQALEQVRAGSSAHLPLLVGTTLDEWRLFRLLDRSLLTERELLSRVGDILAHHPAAPSAEEAVDAYRGALRERGARTTSREVWNAFQTARVFHDPAERLARAHRHAGGETYRYLFTWRSPTMRDSLGACHALELPFLWGATRHPMARPFIGFDTSAHQLGETMQDAWIAFARDGTPSADLLPRWAAYNGKTRPAMVLGRDCHLDPEPLQAEHRLWDRWVE